MNDVTFKRQLLWRKLLKWIKMFRVFFLEVRVFITCNLYTFVALRFKLQKHRRIYGSSFVGTAPLRLQRRIFKGKWIISKAIKRALIFFFTKRKIKIYITFNTYIYIYIYHILYTKAFSHLWVVTIRFKDFTYIYHVLFYEL